MKKHFIKITILAIASVLVSCEKFLEKEPIGKIGIAYMFTDVKGAKVALNGTYGLLLDYYKEEFGMYADVASDNLLLRTDVEPVLVSQFNFNSTQDEEQAAVGHIWLDVLETLNNTNNIINAVPKLKASFPNQNAELNDILAQALTIRALCFFDLSRVYCQPYNYTTDASHLGIPIVISTPGPLENLSRSTMKETYAQITKDILDALPLFRGANTNQVTVNQQSAMALLSRVYLYMGNWEQSRIYATNVITASQAKLAPADKYLVTFLNYPDNSNKEILFGLTAAGRSFSSTSPNVIYSDSLKANYYASTKLLNMFDSGDIRKSIMFTVPTDPSIALKGKSLTRKFALGAAITEAPFFVKVIRLSEMYLNRAEANWNLGNYDDAAADILIISQRAHPQTAVNITFSSPEDLEQQIANERNRELCFEGHRLFDLVRRKKDLVRGPDCNSSTCTLTYPNNKFVLPIPGKELDANENMQPNPGVNN